MAEESSTSIVPSGKMTDEERLALAHKMDQELDDFIDGLERKKYSEGWSEDTWQEEMAKHPFFMKDAPNEPGELSPLAQGLANLKYDPDETTADELATNYKEDGNFNYKHKNYRLAIIGYTEGVKVKCNSAEINAGLYNNRAACHWELKNYRSALADSEKALTFLPDHKRAKLRAARSAFKVNQYDKCIQHSEELIKNFPNDKDITDLLDLARKTKVIYERDLRKKERKERIEKEERDKLINAIKSRGIKIANLDKDDELELANLEPSLPGADGGRVHIEDGILRWPVLILYPEHGTTDFIRNCPENVPLMNQLEQLFPAPWDEEDKYKASTLNVYFEGSDKKAHKIDPRMNLGELLLRPYFALKAGTPAFFILIKNSKAEQKFLRTYV